MRFTRFIPVVLCTALLGAMPHVPHGFTIERIAVVPAARELAIARNGDLFVGTSGSAVYIVPSAEDTPGKPAVFASFDDAPAAGVALGDGALYVGTQFGVYRVPYAIGDRAAAASPVRIASVRTSGSRRGHRTTSLAFESGTFSSAARPIAGTVPRYAILFVSVGSSCNACRPELDATRATIERIDLLHGDAVQTVATNVRNAIALAVDGNHELWAGVAGADDLPLGHPYEIFDDVTAHGISADYGWPSCYENRQSVAAWPGDCTHTAVPLVVFPAYETPIGAAFYPRNATGPHVFPKEYEGGAFVTLHGSWHGPAQGLSGFLPPRVVFVPMTNGRPSTPVDWNDPAAQWREFTGGFQRGGTADRIGRPTGIVVGPQGSLFVSDDASGAIYRIRPT